MDTKFTWVPIYHKLALKIMEYEYNPEDLKNIVFYVQQQIGYDIEAYRGEPMKCIDPLGFFSILEKYNQNNRNKFISKFEEVTGMDIDIPKDYDGIPSTFALEAWLFKDEEDSKTLWNIAKYALEYSETKSDYSKLMFIENYNKAYERRNKDYRIPNQLYKIAPDTFVNLDSNNRNILEKVMGIDLTNFSDGQEYLNICLKAANEIEQGNYEFSSFPEMSCYAWKMAGVYSDRKKEKEENENGDNAYANREVNEWILPANPNYYDHNKSFEKNGFIDWGQNVNFSIGDIVYLYSTMPDSRITAKTVVAATNLTSDEKIDDSEFNLSEELYRKRLEHNRFVRLKLMQYIEDERLSFANLVKHGLWGRPQSAAHIPLELSKYIHFVLDGELYNKEGLHAVNEIYYGGPGCGKSKLVEDKYCKDDNCIRTTFYPDYTNSDFVGQLVPFYNDKTQKLEYRISPGCFSKALEKALKNPEKNIYLIIEEINRGNAAAIFGDVFQLLDRVTTISINDQNNTVIGESEYEISNNIIEEYILSSCGIDLGGKIKIPANMSIIATMNTSDQNVYTLDSAFKRRWNMIHVSNTFEDTEYDIKIGSEYVPMLNCDITWKDFVNRINKAIISINTFGINSEDKQIGKYFVGTADLLEAKVEEYDNIEEASKKFAEKVLMYLWDDIAKLEPTEWFDPNIKTLESLLKKYQKEGIEVFSDNLQSILKPDDDGNDDEEQNI